MAIRLWYRVENLSMLAKPFAMSRIAKAIPSTRCEGKHVATKGGTRLA